jgi:Uma2 family endonuclease
MRIDELLAMPEDGVDRHLIRGRLRERPAELRGRLHASATAWIAHALANWLDQQPAPRGVVLSGSVGCILRRDPDTFVDIDLVYISAETNDSQSEETPFLDGAPVVAVEILSPSDKQEEIDEKVSEYLVCGVAQVWVVNPRFRTITVYRPDAEPVLFNVHQTLTAEPHLPGFSLPLARVFEGQ